MFPHLELNVFHWDRSSFASAGVPGLLRDQDSHPSRTATLLVAQHVAAALTGVCVHASNLDQWTDSSSWPPASCPTVVSCCCLHFLVTDQGLYLCVLSRCFSVSVSLLLSDKVSLCS